MDIPTLHEYGILVGKRKVDIFLTGNDFWDTDEEPGVDYRMANTFIKNLLIAKSRKLPVALHLKTCGGDWTEGIAIYDAIKAYPYEVVGINYTHARSMSSVIFLACDHRIMHEHATFMFHEGTISDYGTVKQYRTGYEENLKSTEQMMLIYIQHLANYNYLGGNKKKIRRWLVKQMDKKEDVYFNAAEALEIGFTDEVIHG